MPLTECSKYNITFTGNNEDNRRYYLPNGGDGFLDFNHLLELDSKLEDIVYVGGKSYVKQFIELSTSTIFEASNCFVLSFAFSNSNF